MALEAPLRSSTGSIHSIMSGFSHQSDMSSTSPAEPHLRPSSVQRVSASLHLMSPSDIVGPSPVTSNGTETTEIEDEQSDEVQRHPSAYNPTIEPQLMMLKTNIPDHIRHSANEESISVIHAPESFHSWTSTAPTAKADQQSERSSPKDDSSMVTAEETSAKSRPISMPTPPPLSTNVRPVRYSLENATPRAQDLNDVLDPARLRSSSTSSLEKIMESMEGETDAEADVEEGDNLDHIPPTPGQAEEQSEVGALRTALQECWTLCNTLANLSSIHRARVFNISGTPDAHEKAWKSCWKLCQRLYDNRDEELESFNVRMNLDLCRDFCQSLFDVRQRNDEIGDSVLRVSFELNNHLYSAQDSRTLPEAFRERTLDFYITLCHRLMKQRNDLREETDSLLRACWSLAEMLFSLRQNKRDGKAPDEELLGSAVQACWELCDIFREGWTAVRPDRNTPRPTQTNFFTHQIDSAGRESRASNRSSLISKRDSLKSIDDRPKRHQPPVPETPVTEFEDTPVSPDTESPSVPNIMVLGTSSEGNRGGRWSSSASNLSSYSQSSAKTSSTATTATAGEDSNIARVKVLVLKAAMLVGYARDASADGKSGMAALQAFVKQLPLGSFGSLPSHATLLQNYKNLVLADTAIPRSSFLPVRGKRVSATEVAKAINYMIHRSGQYSFLRDLFRLVFNFPIEEAESRKNFSIVV